MNDAFFGLLVNAFDKGKGRDGNTNAIFPQDDALDMTKGARVIPNEVTDARRAGQRVLFVQPDRRNQATWYWQMPNGTKVTHGEWE